MVVLKFGGDILSSVKRIKDVSCEIAQRRKKGQELCVVVSAMSDTTDRLLSQAYELNPSPPLRELDMLATTGERMSAALLAIALADEGIPAISFTGSQVGIITDSEHTDARIYQIKGRRLRQALRKGKLPIVCGFQGVSNKKEITTLGRGGSDITAVALAYFLKAKICEFYKKFPGIYTEDPKDFKNVKRLKEISYEEALELTSSGSEVIHPRALALANKYNIKILVRSLADNGGTMIKSSLAPKGMERAYVKTLTHRTDLVRFTFLSVPKVSQCLSQVVSNLAQKRIPFLFFFHGLPHQNRFDLSFILTEVVAAKAKEVLLSLCNKIRAKDFEIKSGIGSISLIGPTVGVDPEVLAKVFDGLKRARIHIDAFSASATNITVYLPRADVPKGVRRLLKEFRLQR